MDLSLAKCKNVLGARDEIIVAEIVVKQRLPPQKVSKYLGISLRLQVPRTTYHIGYELNDGVREVLAVAALLHVEEHVAWAPIRLQRRVEELLEEQQDT
jgi:hypothetical protein